MLLPDVTWAGLQATWKAPQCESEGLVKTPERNGKFTLSQLSSEEFPSLSKAGARLSFAEFSLCKGEPGAKDVSWTKNLKGYGDY